MSEAIWCDYGNHAAKKDDKVFSVSKPDQQVPIRDQFGNHMGIVAGAKVDICGDCAALMGLTNDVTPELPADRHRKVAGEIQNGK